MIYSFPINSKKYVMDKQEYHKLADVRCCLSEKVFGANAWSLMRSALVSKDSVNIQKHVINSRHMHLVSLVYKLETNIYYF